MALPAAGPAGGAAHAFLTATGQKQGVIKGESKTKGHVDEIDLITWGWGMSAPTAVGTTQASGRRVHEPLVVTKRLDAASTKLMNALATNEQLKTVKLALRKAGMDADDFFTIELSLARVANLHVESDGDGGVHEVVKFVFQEIDVSYTPQRGTGGGGGAMTFTDQLGSTA